jgi:dTDP-4-dehydrorhamnose reductase
VKVEVAAPGEFPAKTPRPLYSVLENRRLKELGLNKFSAWGVGLQQYLSEEAVAVPAGSTAR